MGKKVRGVVFSGKGEGEFYVNLYARSFERSLGFRPYPGTLNVRLMNGATRSELIAHVKPLIVKPPPISSMRLALVECYKVKIMNNIKDTYIIVPRLDKYYGEEVVEIIAPFSIREKLNLSDGDVIIIESANS